jgi:flavoprotein
MRDEEEESPLTPEVCPTCGEQLSPGAKACPGCGEVFAPDSKMIEEKIEEDMKKSYREVDPEDTETMEKLDQLNELLKDPEIREMLKEKMG